MSHEIQDVNPMKYTLLTNECQRNNCLNETERYREQPPVRRKESATTLPQPAHVRCAHESAHVYMCTLMCICGVLPATTVELFRCSYVATSPQTLEGKCREGKN